MAEKMNVHMDAPLDFDTPMDQIERLPGFGAWLTGGYVANMELERKEINGKQALEAKFTHIETKQIGETATLEVAEAKPGDSCSTIYFLDNKVAISQMMKEIIDPITAKFGAKTVGEAVKAGNGTKVLVVLKRDRPKDSTRDYSRVVALGFV